jgi:hypothetical protein
MALHISVSSFATPKVDGPDTFPQTAPEGNAPRLNSSLTLLQQTSRAEYASYIRSTRDIF